MIQRIQSIFLLLASGSFFSLFSNPMSFATSEATTNATNTASVLADGIFNIQDDMGLIILTVLGGILTLGAIFLFKNRSLQMKISNLSILVALGTVGFLGFLISKETTTFEMGFGIAAPILAIVFSALATLFIKKDDKIVKSMDRLR